LGSTMTRSPAGQPISSLPLAEIPAFNNSVPVQSRRCFTSALIPRGSSLNHFFGALATPVISVVRVNIFFLSPFLPSPWRRLIISLLQIPKEVVGVRSGKWDAEVMRMGDGWVKGGVGRDPKWGIREVSTAIRQKKVDVDIDNIPQPQLKSNCQSETQTAKTYTKNAAGASALPG
jgi:hypothetical protein